MAATLHRVLGNAAVTQLLAGPTLEPQVRASLESAFGHDFSSVRVRADADAAREASANNAGAFTRGNSIVVGQRPSLELIAHEFAHVVQQRRGGGAPGPAHEAEAAAAAHAVTVGERPRVLLGSATGALQRAAPVIAEKSKVREEGQPNAGVRLCHRVFDLPGPLSDAVPARHCYVAAATDGGTIDKARTATYDPLHSGTPDAVPTKEDWVCSEPYPGSFERVRAEYERLCAPKDFDLGSNNCCSCADRALKAAGITPRPGDFPTSNLGTGLDPSEHAKGWKSEALGLRRGATMGDTEIRRFVAGKSPEALSALPLEGKRRLIDRLLSGIVSDADLDAIDKVVKASSAEERAALGDAYSSRATELRDIGQRTRFHMIFPR